MAGFWGARCDAFTLAFVATPLQLLDVCSAVLDLLVYSVPDSMLEFRRTKREGGSVDVSFLDMFMGLLHLPLTIAVSVVVAVVVVVVKSPLLLLRAYAELWGRTTFYGFNPRHMRKNPLLALGFLLVNLGMPLLLLLLLAWTPLWALWHGTVAAALIPMLGLPINAPLQYFGLPWGYLLSKMLLLNSESNSFIVGSATNLVGVYGMSATNAEDESHVFDFKSAGKACLVGLVSLVCVPVLVVVYLLAVAPVAIITLLVRSISQFTAEEGSRPQKAGNLLMLLLLLPLVLLCMALCMAVSPFLAVLPAQRAYLMCSFAGGFRGILRVVLLIDFKITKALYQTDNVSNLSVLPAGLWDLGLDDQLEEGGEQGPLGHLPRQDPTDRSMIDPMAEHVAAQMQARVYGARGTMSAAAKAKAAQLAAAGALEPAPSTAGEVRAASATSTNEDAIEGPAYAVPPHMRKHVSTVYTASDDAAGQHAEPETSDTAPASRAHSQSTARIQTSERKMGTVESVYPDAATEVTEDAGSEREGPSPPPSRTSSVTAVGATAVKRTLRTSDGESDVEPAPCCACCFSVDPLALPEEPGADGGGDEEAPAYSAAFTITDAPAAGSLHGTGTATGISDTALSEQSAPQPIDVSVPLSNDTSVDGTPAASPAAAQTQPTAPDQQAAVKLSLSSAAHMVGPGATRRWAAAGRARAKLPPHLRSPEASVPPSVPSGKRSLHGIEDEEPSDQYTAASQSHISAPGAQPAAAAQKHAGPTAATPVVGGKRPPTAPTGCSSAPRSNLAPVTPRSATPSPVVQPAVPGDSDETARTLESQESVAAQGSGGTPTVLSPVADSESTPRSVATRISMQAASVDGAAGVGTMGAMSPTAQHSVDSPPSNGGTGFTTVMAAAKLTSKSRSRAQEALQRARLALAEAEQEQVGIKSPTEEASLRAHLDGRGRNRDRQVDAVLALSAPKPKASS